MTQQILPDPDGHEIPRSDESAAVEDLFCREDFSKPENRANVLLLAAVSITPFWSRLHGELGLDADVVLRPERNGIGGRPDLVVRRDKVAVALIECENRDENKDQTAAYEQRKLPVILILGTEQKPARGTTWKCVQQLVREVLPAAEPRQRVILELLDGAIDDIIHLRPRKRPHRVDQADLPIWLAQAAAPLLEHGGGIVKLHTIAKGSASVRLARPQWAFRNNPRNGVFIARSRSGTPDKLYLACPQHLKAHLSQHLTDWVSEKWTDTLRQLGGGIINECGKGQVMVAADGVTAEAVAAALQDFTALLQAHSPVERY